MTQSCFWTAEDMKNEICAIDTLCRDSGHKNLVKVISHGWLQFSNQNSLDSYYFDMELCDYSLEDYIYGTHRPVSASVQAANAGRLGDVLEEQKRRLTETVKIMKQICAAVEFIHNCVRVHRDLNPRNGIHVLLVIIDRSIILWKR